MGVEKGLKKFLRPGLEISCRFWSPLGSLRSPEQHLCRKRHLQNSKPRGSPAGHGPTTELRARAGKPILTVFRMADAVCENRRCAQEIRPGGGTRDPGVEQPPSPHCAGSSAAAAPWQPVIHGGPGEGSGGGMRHTPADRTARHSRGVPLLGRERTAISSPTVRCGATPPGCPALADPAASTVPAPHRVSRAPALHPAPPEIQKAD